MTIVVAREKGVVEQASTEAEIEARKCADIKQEVALKQRDAEEDLAKAEPAVEAAMQALDTLDKRDLGECRTMATPPKGVDDVFVGVMLLVAGVDPNVPVNRAGKIRADNRTWDVVKRSLLGNVNGFLDLLRGFKEEIDEKRVSEQNFKEIRPYLAMPHFDPEVIASKNKAAAGLCSWVVNIVRYRDIFVSVLPKRAALAEANAKLAEANAKLVATQEHAEQLQKRLDGLRADLQAADEEKASAERDVARGRSRLELARRLIRALGDENVRWKAEMARLEQAEKYLVRRLHCCFQMRMSIFSGFLLNWLGQSHGTAQLCVSVPLEAVLSL